jgi:metal-responsive CopG/Arc/MetJ family transcriptional regulator
MKTIAISIDEASLAAIDRMAQRAGRRRGRKGGANRSEVIRRAVREFIVRSGKREREDSDRQILAANREKILLQAEALVGEQAEP